MLQWVGRNRAAVSSSGRVEIHDAGFDEIGSRLPSYRVRVWVDREGAHRGEEMRKRWPLEIKDRI